MVSAPARSALPSVRLDITMATLRGISAAVVATSSGREPISISIALSGRTVRLSPIERTSMQRSWVAAPE